ncbi:branched-chain amino acid ABC transporter permease [Bradyrhizobium sp. U87765 SZCCT0131]|nr:branched-chain amino acid ABC transporter permease [Bradyrhizobium sp. U87765 SZCCT0131]MBR1265151.1 branched-chain amino acid ABC transporter permease [Bradyrhizobium sp. U87765 SZCCT0134]MBR1303070.1 branched-chain amino acid ABC transporter permease [Bradyrhizobium sp. U87765 SZCCT0110]MBR1318676.1 branched-chain amino acid ABC transporter permease [Bradyrhizobium sp. U87765 SZCCT0109]MBR1346999.1 branched-chain amino acid ABC transporter permease [Bradyrhizobium sp. U87765 SZCCT0048]
MRTPSDQMSLATRSFPVELAGLGVVAVLGLIGYLLFPDDLAFLTRLISLTLLVLSLDLVTGYCGVATLGQAALFGVSAYVVGNACLAGITNPIVLLVIGLVSGTFTGLVSGALITRFRGLPQLVLSIAFGQLIAALCNKLSAWTGGSDGLSGISPAPVLGLFSFDMYSRTAYVFSVVVLAVVLTVLLRFVRSPFGLLCRGIRDDDLRARALGVSVYPRLVAMYGVSGAVAGIGGALMAITTGVVGLDSVGFERSAETLVMLVLGGAGHLWGALVGAVIFQIFEHIVSATNPFHWMTLVGLLLVLIVVFAPKGLVHGVAVAWSRLRSRGEQA